MFSNIWGKYKSLPIGVKAAAWYTVSNMAQKAISLLVVPVYTRLLSTSEYGTYSVFISWLEIFEIIATLRLFYGAYLVGLVKFEPDKKSYTSSLQTLSVMVTTGCLLVYLLFRAPINAFTGMPTELTLLLFAILYATPLIGFWKARQRVENLYVKMVALTLVMAVLTPLLGILAILFVHERAASIIAARTIVEVGAAACLLVAGKKYFFAKCKPVYWKYALKTNLPLVPYYLSTVILNHSDRIVIQQMVGSAEAGIYSVAYSAAMVMHLFSSALTSSLQPWLFKRLKSKEVAGISQTVSFSVVVVAVANLALVLLAPEAIALLAPSQYYNAVWIVPPVAASVVVMYIYQQFINVEFYYEESKLIAAASIGAAVLNLVLNVVLIPVFGYLAAGYTTLVSYLVFAVVHYRFMVHICKKHQLTTHLYNIRFMALVLAGYLVVTALALATYNSPFIRYAMLLATGALLLWKHKLVMAQLKTMFEKKE